MERESHVNDKPFNRPFTHQKRSSKCLVYILLFLVFLSISFLISWHVVLRIKTPTLRLSTVNIQHLYYDSSSLNMTIVTKIDLHNPNFWPFKFFGGPTTLLYENMTIGTMRIHDHGTIRSKKKRELIVTMKVIGSGHELKSENYANFLRDIGLGLIKFGSFGEVTGEVRVVKIIHRRVSAVMNCSMDLNLKSQGMQDLLCR